MESTVKSIVITGASSGIGLSTCKEFLKQGYLVFGSVRTKNDASKLKKIFNKNFFPLIFDVENKKAITQSVATVKKNLGENNLTALVNNAGIAILGPLEFIEPCAFQKQLDTNLTGTLNCIQAFLPLLGTNPAKPSTKKGRIINVSSALGGKIGYPFYGAYCSSKHALEGFSEALRRELAVHGIFVSIIAPGAIKTPIWNKAENKAFTNNYVETVYGESYQKVISDMKNLGKNGLEPETVARKIIHAVETRNPRIRYTFIREMSLNLLYLAPRRLIDKLVIRHVGLKRNNLPKKSSESFY